MPLSTLTNERTHPMAMDIRKIQKLIDLLNKSGISEIEIKEGEQSVRLSKHFMHADAPQRSAQPPIAIHAPIAQQTHHDEPPKSTIKHETHPIMGHIVRSPMVGTFYTAASPDATPFVSIGQAVNIGDTLCVIEAMKMFNEIEADKSGKITQILANNGEPVEYDQPLFVIE